MIVFLTTIHTRRIWQISEEAQETLAKEAFIWNPNTARAILQESMAVQYRKEMPRVLGRKTNQLGLELPKVIELQKLKE